MSKCPHPFIIKNPNVTFSMPYQHIEVPCGKCVICQRNKQKEWAFRLCVEEKYSDSALFLTLTYSDDNLPFDNATGKPTLVKRDCQLFLKRLRKAYSGVKLRYYLVGEYGSKYGRPHYHCILFNLPFKNIEDAQKIIEKFWSFGFVHVGSVNHASIMYCSKYSIKIHTDRRDKFPVKEFMLCSKKPYIGYMYTFKYVDRHMKDPLRFTTYSAYPHAIPRIIKSKLSEVAIAHGYLDWSVARLNDRRKVKSTFDLYLEWREKNPNNPFSNYNPYHEEEIITRKVLAQRERERF